jgi:hypothetical protein
MSLESIVQDEVLNGRKREMEPRDAVVSSGMSEFDSIR